MTEWMLAYNPEEDLLYLGTHRIDQVNIHSFVGSQTDIVKSIYNHNWVANSGLNQDRYPSLMVFW